MSLIAAAITCWAPAAGASGGVLEQVKQIRVDPTVVEHPEKVDDKMASNLIPYNLRAAVRDAHFEEGASPLHVHFVLEAYSTESKARRALNLGTGLSPCTIDGRLVVEDSEGKELASVKIHTHGSVAFAQGETANTQGHATSDFEQRLIQELEGLK